ncbi:MAG: hypothetical protein KY459_04890 [Acidobacteria bacterium]|nr:hypothetical protein [Acidobacteriota bacterium]
MSRMERVAFGLLILAAASRIMMQLAALPPYAGLDEIYHVARVAFVAEEGRNPTPDELSIPLYLQKSLAREPGWMPDFARAGAGWPELVAGDYQLPPPRRLTEAERRTYVLPNYEAQQPSPWYTLAASVRELVPDLTPRGELRALRLLSGALAVATIAVTGLIGWMLRGMAGLVAASILLFIPTWQTLVARAGNDALACFLAAAALALTIRGSERWWAILAEGLAWAGAIAVKLYTWPMAVLIPLVWWRRKPGQGRMATVLVLCALSGLSTISELGHRTGTSLGLAVFNPVEKTAESVDIDYAGMVKVTIASGIWMSGQHNNALTVAGMGLYVLPPLLLIALLLIRRRMERDDRYWFAVSAVTLVLFAASQCVHALAHIADARALGLAMPLAGKEGWYWFVLAPLLFPVVAGFVLERGGRFVATGFAMWFLVWDVVITEGALLRDYGGLSSPELRSFLFRWGPEPRFGMETFESVSRLSVGPLAEAVPVLRLVSVAATGGLLVILLRSDRSRAV